MNAKLNGDSEKDSFFCKWTYAEHLQTFCINGTATSGSFKFN